ncbi:phage tail assembly chaperone [Oceanobacillus oncorhynchi]|uniref:phage tail assembly chaperone n=1 Tax=Oceanobacillus oncorhynchi TaxID=545501 RepID=UPI001D0044EE|nr:phage tail assembly chaperone [Oceanobacillus oncorhynchi]
MKYAVGAFGYTPNDFWEMTLAEFNVMMDGYIWRNYQERVKMAEHARWILSPQVKQNKMPDIEKMVGEPPGEKEKRKKERELTTKNDLEEIKNNMGI